MHIDIQELPDELIWTATMAAAMNSPAAAAVLEGIAERLLKDIDDLEFKERYQSLQELFAANPPDGLEELKDFGPERMAKWIIGLTGLIGAHMEVEEALNAAINEIVAGVKDSVLSFAREHR